MSAQQRSSTPVSDLFALGEGSGRYHCALCHTTHRFGAQPEVAEVEFDARFPGQDIEEAAIVCDACYRSLGLGSN